MRAAIIPSTVRNPQETMAPITQDISEMIDYDSFYAGEENTREGLKQKKVMLHSYMPEGWYVHYKLHFTGSQAGISCKSKN